MTKKKEDNSFTAVIGFLAIGFFGIVTCIFVLVYFPLMLTDFIAIQQGIPFNHAEIQVYNCDSVRNMSTIKVMEEYTIFRGGFSDRLLSNEDYYLDHCRTSYNIQTIYNPLLTFSHVENNDKWCCYHYTGD